MTLPNELFLWLRANGLNPGVIDTTFLYVTDSFIMAPRGIVDPGDSFPKVVRASHDHHPASLPLQYWLSGKGFWGCDHKYRTTYSKHLIGSVVGLIYHCQKCDRVGCEENLTQPEAWESEFYRRYHQHRIRYHEPDWLKAMASEMAG